MHFAILHVLVRYHIRLVHKKITKELFVRAENRILEDSQVVYSLPILQTTFPNPYFDASYWFIIEIQKVSKPYAFKLIS